MTNYDARRQPRRPQVTVTIDPDACMAVGECQRDLPEVFAIGHEGIVVLRADPTHFDRDEVARAVASCPNFALELLDGVCDE